MSVHGSAMLTIAILVEERKSLLELRNLLLGEIVSHGIGCGWLGEWEEGAQAMLYAYIK